MADLSNLGLIAPSLGSAADTGVPAPGASNPLDALLMQNDMTAERQNQSQLMQQMQQLSGAQPAGLLDRLLSPQGLITALGAGGLALAGQPAAGAGVALGGIGAVQGQQAEFLKERDDQIAALRKELEASRDREDKSRQRFVTLLSSQPDMFSSPDGEAPNPKVLGWYATGTDIPLYPGSKRIQDQRGESWKNILDLQTKGLASARTPDDAKIVLNGILQHLGWKNPDPAEVDALARSYGTPEGNLEAARILEQLGGNSAVDAFIYAGKHNLPYLHPDVLSIIKLNPPTPDAMEPSQQLNLKYLTIFDKVSKWQSDPKNAEMVTQVKLESGGDTAAEDRAMAEMALGGNTSDVNFYLNKQNTQQLPVDQRVFMDAWNTVAAKDKIVDTVRSAQGLPAKQKMSDEEILNDRAKKTISLIQETQGALQSQRSNQDAGLRNKMATSMSKELHWGTTDVYGLVNDVWSQALRDAPKDTNGLLIREEFEKLLAQYTDLAIQQNKTK